jgi:hypothetical protein
MVIAMTNEFDAKLTRLFADAREPLDEAEFLTALLARIERARRARLWRQTLIVAAVLTVAALNLPAALNQIALWVHSFGEFSSAYAEFAVTPWGWVMSMLIGAWALFRTRPARR